MEPYDIASLLILHHLEHLHLHFHLHFHLHYLDLAWGQRSVSEDSMGCGQDGRYAEARVPMDYAARQANAAVPMGDGLLAWVPMGWWQASADGTKD